MEIVPYKPEHFGELLTFLRSQFPASPYKGQAAFFRWRFEESPLGSSLDHYYLAMENGRIAGQLAAIRDRIWAKGRWWDCCWLVDLIVAPEFRGAGSTAAPRLFRMAMKECPLLLATGAGPRFYKALRWSYREVAGTYFAVRRPRRLLSVAQDVGETRPLLKPWLPLADLAMTAVQSARRAWRASRTSEFEFNRLEHFGDETGDLIDRVLPSLAVTSHRSPDQLNWKFHHRPAGTHFVIAGRRGGNSSIDGYVAVKIMERSPYARWAEIVDYLVDPRTPALFDFLLDEAARQALLWDVDFLRLRCALPQHQNRLTAPFWIRRDRPVIDATFFRTDDAGLAKCLATEPWHLTSLVSDRTDHGADELSPEPSAQPARSCSGVPASNKGAFE